ncbi:MAG: hypothetical protein FD143_3728, partial [Ignavibacteria bacterium]
MRDLICPYKDLVEHDELYQTKFVASMNNSDLQLENINTLQKIAMVVACNRVFYSSSRMNGTHYGSQ